MYLHFYFGKIVKKIYHKILEKIHLFQKNNLKFIHNSVNYIIRLKTLQPNIIQRGAIECIK